jgi:hypothetical protein
VQLLDFCPFFRRALTVTHADKWQSTSCAASIHVLAAPARPDFGHDCQLDGAINSRLQVYQMPLLPICGRPFTGAPQQKLTPLPELIRNVPFLAVMGWVSLTSIHVAISGNGLDLCRSRPIDDVVDVGMQDLQRGLC